MQQKMGTLRGTGTIDLLADETLLHVFRMLPVQSLVAVGQVSQRWRRVSRDRGLWRAAELSMPSRRTTRSAARTLLTTLRVAPCLRRLTLDGSIFQGHMQYRALKMGSECTIQELELRNRMPPCLQLLLLTQQSDNLVSLFIENVDCEVLSVIQRMKNLRHLHVHNSCAVLCSRREQRLHTLKLTGWHFSGLVRMLVLNSSSTLEEAVLPINESFVLFAVGSWCKNLRRLNITDVHVVPHPGFLSALRDLPLLTELAISVHTLLTSILRYVPEQVTSLRVQFIPTSGLFSRLSLGKLRPLLDTLPQLTNLRRLVLVNKIWDGNQCPECVAFVRKVKAEVPPWVTCVFETSYYDTCMISESLSRETL